MNNKLIWGNSKYFPVFIKEKNTARQVFFWHEEKRRESFFLRNSSFQTVSLATSLEGL